LRIVRGGSAETASGRWVKFDVELDESDLQRILVENDMSGARLSVREVFSILEAEAETLILLKMEQLGARGDRSAREQAARVTKIMNKLQDNFDGGNGDNEI
jgi:hypothetical protein